MRFLHTYHILIETNWIENICWNVCFTKDFLGYQNFSLYTCVELQDLHTKHICLCQIISVKWREKFLFSRKFCLYWGKLQQGGTIILGILFQFDPTTLSKNLYWNNPTHIDIVGYFIKVSIYCLSKNIQILNFQEICVICIEETHTKSWSA